MTRAVDYDAIAGGYDRRYQVESFRGTAAVVHAFAGHAGLDVLEVGCGTGHWLELLERDGAVVAGLDFSAGMLGHALRRLPGRLLVRGTASRLPFADGSFDRVYCVHALHHFDDGAAFAREARRVLRPGGELLSIGLDPHDGVRAWPIYDWFDGTRARDLERYRPTAEMLGWLAAAGLADGRVIDVEHVTQRRPAAEAFAEGHLEKGSTSQLALLTDEAFAVGVARIRAAMAEASARGEELVFELDLRIRGITARAP